MRYMDFHTHVLFGIDHGVKEEGTYERLISEYGKAGFSVVALTPHIYHPDVHTNTGSIRGNFAKAEEIASRYGVKVVLGSELYIDSQLDVRSLPVAGRFALCEFPPDRKPAGLEAKLGRLASSGLVPVIAHVERYRWLSPEGLRIFADCGALVQVNVAHVEDNTARKYLDSGLVDLIASDNHGDASLPMRLRNALDDNYDVLCRMQGIIDEITGE